MTTDSPAISQVTSGIPGLDDALRGGFTDGRTYLVCGSPGTGKTTVGMHFVAAGLAQDETVLIVHGEESSDEIVANAAQFDIDLADAEFLDLGPDSDFFAEDRSYDLVDPSEIAEDRYTADIHAAIEAIDPSRIVIDPITQLRYIERSEHQYRKRILSFMRFLKERSITVLATATLDERGGYTTGIRSLSDGVIKLKNDADGRRVEVTKNRGYGQMDGEHGLEIRTEGIEVFPTLVHDAPPTSVPSEQLSSGIPALDALAGGGFERGTVTFFTGPTGVGKTTTGTQYLAQAATDGLQSSLYLFEERVETFEQRSRSLGIPVETVCESGALSVTSIEPTTLSSEEFAHMVKDDVETNGTDLVMIDGVEGYTESLKGTEPDLVRQFQSLMRYLTNRGVTVLVTDSIPEMSGFSTATSTNLSHVTDNILVLRYANEQGTLRKLIGVLKKRTGGFERSLREFEIRSDGIHVGAPVGDAGEIFEGRPWRGTDADTSTEE